MKVKRLHDDFYLKENRYNIPKDSFIYIVKKLNKKKLFKLIIRFQILDFRFQILDIGCAAGELIYYLKKNMKFLDTIVIFQSKKLCLINFTLKSKYFLFSIYF